MNDIILKHPPFSNAKFILAFNLATGIKFVRPRNADINVFLEEFDGAEAKELAGYFKQNLEGAYLEAALGLFGLCLTMPNQDKGKPLLGIVIDNLDTIVPPEAASSSCQIDRRAYTALLSWAKDPEIRKSGNIIALITDNLNSLPARLKSETSEINICEVKLPKQIERQEAYEFAKKNSDLFKEDLAADVFGKSSGGMSVKAIINLVREQTLRKEPVTSSILFERKKKFINERSGGLLEIQRPLWGIEAIGALNEVKTYLALVAANIMAGKFGEVPNGILLIGPPGTGKTVFAQSLAHEADIPFLVMKNIKNPYVGMSGINQNFVFELMKANQPVIVFIDEIDQQFQIRSMIGDNTGVNQELMAGFLKFMGDTDWRGRILWVAATNKPHLMDEAMVRSGRFDVKIPFFPPSTTERASIVKALLAKNSILAEHRMEVFKWDLTDEDIMYFARRAHCHIKYADQNPKVVRCHESIDHPLGLTEKEDRGEVYYTGGDIENVLQRAREVASKDNKPLNRDHLIWALNDFILGQDVVDYERMTELAVSYTNSARFLPTKGRWAGLASERGVVMDKTSSSPSKANFS